MAVVGGHNRQRLRSVPIARHRQHRQWWWWIGVMGPVRLAVYGSEVKAEASLGGQRRLAVGVLGIGCRCCC